MVFSLFSPQRYYFFESTKCSKFIFFYNETITLSNKANVQSAIYNGILSKLSSNLSSLSLYRIRNIGCLSALYKVRLRDDVLLPDFTSIGSICVSYCNKKSTSAELLEVQYLRFAVDCVDKLCNT